MKRFMTYLNERSPLPALTFLSAGIALSAVAIDQSFSWVILVLGILLNNFLFIQMRLGDELKDFETDKQINPTRPLPRGLFQTSEVQRLLEIFLTILIASGLVIGVLYSALGGSALVIASIFSWLMYKEFYISHTLDKSPMIYALSHQIIVFPLFAWPGLTLNPTLITDKIFLGWLLGNFGASFTFEICRKLNPSAHELAKTYAHHYGRTRTVLFCLIFMTISAVGSYIAHIHLYALPALSVLLISLVLWHQKPEKYKLPAGLSALSSTVLLWTPAIMWIYRIWSLR
jgi:hypothetical protein